MPGDAKAAPFHVYLADVVKEYESRVSRLPRFRPKFLAKPRREAKTLRGARLSDSWCSEIYSVYEKSREAVRTEATNGEPFH